MSNKVIEIRQHRFPTDLYYTDRHLWLRRETDGSVVVGVDDFGQKLAGRIVSIRLPAEGTPLEPGKVFGTMESTKWVERLRSQITGVVKSVNQRLRTAPSLVNEDPYGNGWFVAIKPTGNIDQELSKMVTGNTIESWAGKEIEEKERLIPKKGIG